MPAWKRSFGSISDVSGAVEGSSSWRMEWEVCSDPMAIVRMSCDRPVRWAMRGMVWKLEQSGGMSGREVSGEMKVKGMALKRVVVKACGKWDVLAPRKLRPLVIQMRAVGGASELPSRW